MSQRCPQIPLRTSKVFFQKKGASKSSPEILPAQSRESPLHEDISSRIFDFKRRKEKLDVPSLEKITVGDYKTFPEDLTVGQVLNLAQKYKPEKRFDYKKEAIRLLQSPALKNILMSKNRTDLINELNFLYRENSERGYRTSLGKTIEDMAVSLLEHSLSEKSLEIKDRHGLDTIIQTNDTRYQIEMKTSENWGNTSSKAGTSVKFMKARKSAIPAYEQDRIHSIVLNLSLYDTLPGFYWDENNYLQINGRYAWEFITKDPYFAVFLRLRNIYDIHKTDNISSEQIQVIADCIIESDYFSSIENGVGDQKQIVGNILFDYP